MRRAWNKGLTKETNSSLMKTSLTMKSRKIDNFSLWREKQVKVDYVSLNPSPKLAEYIGVVLGDGNISRFPRTERILIVGDIRKIEFIDRYAKITEELFHKKPSLGRIKNANTIRISLFQKYISQRLGIPIGNRANLDIQIPNWIWQNEECLISFVRGLFEAEGSLSIHLGTYTYNLQFSNKNTSLLKTMEKALKLLGYNPEVRINCIRLRRKQEIQSFLETTHFRDYK